MRLNKKTKSLFSALCHWDNLALKIESTLTFFQISTASYPVAIFKMIFPIVAVYGDFERELHDIPLWLPMPRASDDVAVDGFRPFRESRKLVPQTDSIKAKPSSGCLRRVKWAGISVMVISSVGRT